MVGEEPGHQGIGMERGSSAGSATSGFFIATTDLGTIPGRVVNAVPRLLNPLPMTFYFR